VSAELVEIIFCIVSTRVSRLRSLVGSPLAYGSGFREFFVHDLVDRGEQCLIGNDIAFSRRSFASSICLICRLASLCLRTCINKPTFRTKIIAGKMIAKLFYRPS